MKERCVPYCNIVSYVCDTLTTSPFCSVCFEFLCSESEVVLNQSLVGCNINGYLHLKYLYVHIYLQRIWEIYIIPSQYCLYVNLSGKNKINVTFNVAEDCFDT